MIKIYLDLGFQIFNSMYEAGSIDCQMLTLFYYAITAKLKTLLIRSFCISK